MAVYKQMSGKCTPGIRYIKMKRKNKEREESSMKKTFKKLLALTLTGVLVAGALSGCGKKEDKDSKTDL